MKTDKTALLQLVKTSIKACLTIVLLSASYYVSAYELETDATIHVVGDVHGAYNEIQQTLKTLKLIDDNNNWSGGKAHFVSLGDLMDRGYASRKVIDLFMQLQQQAKQAGGGLHVVLGNHEVMNLIGDRRRNVKRIPHMRARKERAGDVAPVQQDGDFGIDGRR